MIKTIKMKNCATYLSDGVTIENCKKINFFYGANGSGKSTISKYLCNLNDKQYAACEIEQDNDNSEIFVYNRDFREHNLKKEIEGIFTLGEATIDDIKILKEKEMLRNNKNEDLVRRNKSLADKRTEIKQYEDGFRERLWNLILKPNENDFKEAFSGYRGNKEKFKLEVISRSERKYFSNETIETLKQRSKILFNKKPVKCNIIDFVVDELINKIDSIEKDKIWNKIIVGNTDIPIAKFIKQLNNVDWVNQGRKYIIENDKCPFCQQKTITKEFEDQLNAFFSGEYDNDIRHIKNLTLQYITLKEKLFNLIDNISKNNDVIRISGIDFTKFNSLKNSLDILMINSIGKMHIKEKEASIKIELNKSNDIIKELKNIILLANEKILKHNHMVENFNEEKQQLINDIWNYFILKNEILINESMNKLNNLKRAEAGIKKGRDICKKQLEELDEEIIDKNKNITSIQPTVNEINRLLAAYGFTNFKIVPSAEQRNYYQIQRIDGSLATNTLSEGEETFISFLYFWQYTKGANDPAKVSAKKIIVLDDPICSLDSNVLYIVSSMVRSLIKDIREEKNNVEQLFIFTHNVFFHKEASFIDIRTDKVNDINYWIIAKDDNRSFIRSFGTNNPIKSSYQLLWQELKDNTSISKISIQNIMRRIIENYFNILGQGIDDKIVCSLESIEEQIIARSLISWINDGSHTIPDDLYIDSCSDTVERYKEVFEKIFEKMGHKAHYDMMMCNTN